jgi:hypothetical protein
MSEYPEDAPAFSSDEENKADKGLKSKDAKTAKKQADLKTQPNKYSKQNNDNARVKFPRFPAASRDSASDRRSRI